jgi:Domain of unknown function (DUF4115)
VVASAIVCLTAAALYATLGTRGSGAPAAGTSPTPPALRIDVTGARSLVFVRRPGGEVLVNQTLTHGRSVHFNGTPLDVVVSDPKAVRAYVHGRPWPVDPTGRFIVS